MQALLVKLINNKDDGFWLCCVGLDAFVFKMGVCALWLGQEACVALSRVF
jgi:hypothetical protein